ncbi:uncharacterized protein CLUP02_00469 [Colletotrichum lupini]|uniref:Protein kinase domain-containing protein n=1 Tax=Colletotrichum lupini TaxID=145971 RepID=A0A9Q8W8T1_9PEZI|nr:uncharacterized protein CLUP02_00469 [Colletotrichum lupini]UQC73822.1 hypothetical protein CLUP02_00469 [Colletotrichum lupini]
MNHDSKSDFKLQYQIALSEFVEIRREETRTSACKQKFVLVDNVTKRLKSRSATCSTQYDNNLDRLQRTAYLQYELEPPQMRAQHYEEDEYLAIFYTLLDIQAPSLINLFRDNGLNKLPIELTYLKKCIKPPPKPRFHDFHERFYKTQFDWCPIRFDMGMRQVYRDAVSPLSRKEKITPYREGKGPKENNATLYAIDVPEELVGRQLREKMASAKIERQGEGRNGKGLTYRFALKQFRPHKHEHFLNEIKMFSNLEHEEGMIQYIGWFGSFELGDDGAKQEYFNIVLELADFDFYEAMMRLSPPISSEEIHGFWESMFEISKTLASIHTITIAGMKYWTWHGDIKPENILRVNDRFKLADPGEASMLLKNSATPYLPPSKSLGGTRTYAAPEKTAYLDDISTKRPKVTPESDVWSLGCVLSIAATYVVLGTQGVLIYQRLRRQDTQNARGRMSDAFHDGEQVLPEVLHWHQYLREAARRTDPYTSAILDMVDGHMLVPGDRRETAKKVCSSFKSIIAKNDTRPSKVPPGLQHMLQSIELEVERSSEHKSGIKRVDSDDITKPMERFDLPLPEIEFESQKKLLDQAIQPTAQRPRTMRGSPTQSPHQSVRYPMQSLDRQGSTHSHSHGYPDPPRGNSAISSSSQPVSAHPTSLNPKPPSHRSRSPIRREPVKASQVKQELKKVGLSFKPSPKSLSSLIQRQKTSVKGKTSNSKESLDALTELDSRLEEEYKGRDIVFLVDNGTTMRKWWSSVIDLLEVMVWRALAYDDDGMEMYFTNPDTNPKATVRGSKSQSVRSFTKALDLAEPAAATSQTSVETTIIPELERIINDYTRAKTSKYEPRKKTIIVLTDGIWRGMHDEYTVDTYLRSTFHCLRDLHGDLTYIHPDQPHSRKDVSEIRPVTIQFVQFGDDKEARERLRRLDDDLAKYGCPDLIDTEHAEGDLYKMFLGSLCPDIDRTLRYSIGPQSPSSIPHVPPGQGSGTSTNVLSLRTNTLNQPPQEPYSLAPLQTSPLAITPVDFSVNHHGAFMPTTPNYELPASSHDGPSHAVSPMSPQSSPPQRDTRWQVAGPSSENASPSWPTVESSSSSGQHEQTPRSPAAASPIQYYRHPYN